MTQVYDQAKHSLYSEDFSSFRYLSAINTLLSNPVSYDLGRDLIVRALDARDRFSIRLRFRVLRCDVSDG